MTVLPGTHVLQICRFVDVQNTVASENHSDACRQRKRIRITRMTPVFKKCKYGLCEG